MSTPGRACGGVVPRAGFDPTPSRLDAGAMVLLTVDLTDLDVLAVSVAEADEGEVAATDVRDPVRLTLVLDVRSNLVDVGVLGVRDPAHGFSKEVVEGVFRLPSAPLVRDERRRQPAAGNCGG